MLVPVALVLLAVDVAVELAVPVGVMLAPKSGIEAGAALVSVLEMLTNTQSASYLRGLMRFGPVILLYASLTRVSCEVLYVGQPYLISPCLGSLANVVQAPRI